MYNLILLEKGVYTSNWYIGMYILLGVLMLPWIYLIIRFGIFRKLRVRFIIDSNTELAPIYLKKGKEIILPKAPTLDGKEFVGWYLDKDFDKPYKTMLMPDENIKLYAKYVEKEN